MTVRDRGLAELRPVVLVVDDHQMMRDLTRRSLEARGCETFVAVDGIDALNVLRDRTVDLVLSDISMPRMEGTDLALRLRVRLGSPKIVLMSADPDADPRIPGVGFVVKPLRPDVLDDLIEQTRRSRPIGHFPADMYDLGTH